MELIQSRFQDVFSRIYEMACHVIWYLIFALLASLILKADIDLPSYLTIALIVTMGPIVYLYFSHQGGTKRILMDEEKFIYTDFDTISEFAWSDYQGYKISKTIPHQVIIKNKVHGKTEFCYYAFSSGQRRELFDMLDKKLVND